MKIKFEEIPGSKKIKDLIYHTYRDTKTAAIETCAHDNRKALKREMAVLVPR
jgi:hypothetical protein